MYLYEPHKKNSLQYTTSPCKVGRIKSRKQIYISYLENTHCSVFIDESREMTLGPEKLKYLT